MFPKSSSNSLSNFQCFRKVNDFFVYLGWSRVMICYLILEVIYIVANICHWSYVNDSSSNMVVVNISSGIIRSVNVCLMDFICIFQHALIQISFDGSLEEILNRVAYCVVNFVIHTRYRFVPLSLTIHDTYNLLAMIYFNGIMKSVSRSVINISQWIAFVVIKI